MRDEVIELRKAGESVASICRQYGLKRERVERWVKGVVPVKKRPKAIPRSFQPPDEEPDPKGFPEQD